MYDVFGIDALESSKAISIKVDNPDYDMTYGRLSYGKGNCLVRMIENIITTDTFNHGITHYLNNQAYGNAKHTDLWAALDEDAHSEHQLEDNLHVGLIMEGWTRREGYPVITVESAMDNTLTLSQKRFFLNPDAPASDFQWYVPINAAYPGDAESFEMTKPEQWMSMHNQEITFTVDSAPYVLNVQETGYYRVNYDAENWEALTDQLFAYPTSIHRLNRAQLLDDSYNLARAGQLNYSYPLYLSQYIQHEDEYVPFKAFLMSLDYVDKMFRESQNVQDDGGLNYEYLQNYTKNILTPLYDGQDNFVIDPEESLISILKKKSLISWMCEYGLVDCIDQASSQFNDWMLSDEPDSNNPIDPDLKQTIYQVAIANGDDKEFDFLWDRLVNIENTLDTVKILYGLGSSPDPDNLNLLLNETIQENSAIRSQDAIYVYRAVGDTTEGRVAQFEWLDEYYDEIKAFYGPLFPSMVTELLNPFLETATSQGDIDDVQDFLEEHQADLGSAVAAINQGLDTAAINMNWVAMNYIFISGWLEQNQDFPDVTTAVPVETTTTPESQTSTTSAPTDPTTTTTTTTTESSADSVHKIALATLPFLFTLMVSI